LDESWTMAVVSNTPIAALCAAHDAQAPFLTIIFNNGGYNASKMPVVDLFPDGAAVEADDFPATRFRAAPDYAMIPRACHAYGERVDDPDEVLPALQRGLAAVRDGQAAVLDMVLKKI
jgi:acetolactate synthase I/II/III large subunit